MAKNANKNMTVLYSGIQLGYWMGYAVIFSFASVFLLAVGLTNSEIGVVLAVGSLLSALIQPVLGSISDKSERFPPRFIVIILGIIITIVSLILLLTSSITQALWNAIIYAFVVFVMLLLQPSVNTMGVASLNDGKKINLGISRAIGSLGCALSAFFLGIIVEKCGINTIPVSIVICFVIMIVFALVYPSSKITVSGKANIFKMNPTVFFRKYKMFSVLLIGLVMVYYSHILLNNYTLQIIIAKGGGSAQLGMATAIAPIAGMIIMIPFPWLMKKVKLNLLIKISGVFFCIKTLLSFLVQDVVGFYLAQLLQIGAWGIMTIGIVYYVNEVVDKSDVATGQAFAAVSHTMATVIGTLTGGWLIDGVGVDNMLLIGTVVAAVGAGIIMLTAKDTKITHQQ